MNSLPKLIMMIGVVLIIIGFLMQFIKLGRLPGDIIIRLFIFRLLRLFC